jgi:hypothetical protein
MLDGLRDSCILEMQHCITRKTRDKPDLLLGGFCYLGEEKRAGSYKTARVVYVGVRLEAEVLDCRRIEQNLLSVR